LVTGVDLRDIFRKVSAAQGQRRKREAPQARGALFAVHGRPG
jgi:hypothetical protein